MGQSEAGYDGHGNEVNDDGNETKTIVEIEKRRTLYCKNRGLGFGVFCV